MLGATADLPRCRRVPRLRLGRAEGLGRASAAWLSASRSRRCSRRAARADDRTGLQGRQSSAPAQVRAVADGRTVPLTDGREVRLAGIEVPDAAATGGRQAALETLVAGREIRLAAAGPGQRPLRPGGGAGIAAARRRTIRADGRCWRRATRGLRPISAIPAALPAFLSAEKTARAAGAWPLGGPVLCDAQCRGSGGDPRGSGPFRRG